MFKRLAKLFLIFFVFTAILPAQKAEAQGVESEWSQPFRISSLDLKAGPASLLSDKYGLTHIFWSEELPDSRSVIKYSRYDGEVFSVPISIYISGPDQIIKGLSPIVDDNAILHLYWTEGILLKGVKYMYAPVQSALSATDWSSPIRLTIYAEEIRVKFAPDGTRHIMLFRVDQGSQGVYHTFSTNGGITWSVPTWLDLDIPAGFVPRDLNFEMDDRGGLHAVWGYAISDLSVDFNNWIRYAGLPSGETEWKLFTIDRVDPEDKEAGYQLNAASPVMTISGPEVVVIWAGGTLHYRHFRYSGDYGETWSNPVRVFGDLNGQAQDGFAVDSLGRIHYFAQIRFPVGIYHAVWDGERWSSPSIVYFIRYSGADNDGSKVEAHFTLPVIDSGNKMLLTFTEPPSAAKRGLFAMTTVIQDAPAIDNAAFPENVTAPTPFPTPTSEPAADATSVAVEPSAAPVETEATVEAAPTTASAPTGVVSQVPEGESEDGPQATTNNTALIVGMVISLLVVVGIVAARMFARR